jgi:hypothetical protein
VFNAKIVVDGRVTSIHWIADTRRVRVWIQIHTHERLWVRVWIEFCLVGMDSRTIYPCTTRPIAIPSQEPVVKERFDPPMISFDTINVWNKSSFRKFGRVVRVYHYELEKVMKLDL